MMLLIISETAYPSTIEDDPLNSLVKVNPGYFLPDGVVKKIIKQHPELEQIFENALRVGSGYYMSDGTTMDLANYVQDINDENIRLQATADRLNNALEEEREAVQKIFNEKDNVNELLREQVRDYKELYEYKNKDPDIFGKASDAAGVIALLLLLGNL